MSQNNLLLQALMSALGTPAEEAKRGPAVKIVPNDTRQNIRISANNPEFGHIVLRQMETKQASRRWVKTEKRQCLMLGTVEELKAWMEDKKSGIVPGKIVFNDYLENEVPEDIMKDFFGNLEEKNPQMFVEQYERLVRRAGQDGPELIADGQRILRFSFLDPTSEEEDRIIDHDNNAELSQFSKQRREEERLKRVEELKAKEAELASKKETVEAPVTNEAPVDTTDAKSGKKDQQVKLD